MALLSMHREPAGDRRKLLQALCAGVIAIALALTSVRQCRADGGGSAAEYQVKAAFLYKFVSYVDWPPRAFPGIDSPLVIGVIGADTLAESLRQIVANRTVNNRAIVIRRMRRGDPVSGLHVLFIGRADGERAADMLAQARGQSVLTVTESEDALASGSMINFVVVDDKVRFDIALDSAERVSLRISARLLTVARKVVASPS